MNLLKLLVLAALLTCSVAANAASDCFDEKHINSDLISHQKAKLKILPKYPTFAARDNVSGCVALSFNIEKNGRVSNVKIAKSSPKRIFDRNSIKALSKWVFENQDYKSTETIIFQYAVGTVPPSNQNLVISLGIDTTASSKIATLKAEEENLSKLDKLKRKISKADSKSASKIANLKHQISLLEFEFRELQKIQKVKGFENKQTLYRELNKSISDKRSTFEIKTPLKSIDYAETFNTEQDELAFLRTYRIKKAKENKIVESEYLSLRAEKQLKVSKLKLVAGMSKEELTEHENKLIEQEKINLHRAKLKAEAQKKKEEELAKFYTLGDCEVGNSVYHREVWNTKTSSGNIIADGLFGAATKESFIITYEAIVEGFLGDKVKTIINDYKIQQTLGGGFLDQKTYRKYEIAKHADKYIGRTQFYKKSRCN